MPVVLIPLHFDRDSIGRIPSCQHSVVLRPFCTQDFMTGIPATPGKEIPEEVSAQNDIYLLLVPDINLFFLRMQGQPFWLFLFLAVQ